MGAQVQLPFLSSNEDKPGRPGGFAGPDDESRRKADEARKRRGRSFATLIGVDNEDSSTLLGGLNELGG